MSFKEEIFSAVEKMIQDHEKKTVNTSDNYVIVRTYAMGVFAGYLNERSTETCKVLNKVRRIWHWEGAATLSELAQRGTSKPDKCMFPAEVDEIELTSPQGFEVLKVSEEAKNSIESVKIWTT